MAGSACAVVTGAAVVVGVVTTSQAQPDVVVSKQPVTLEPAAQPATPEPPVEVPVEVRPVSGFEEPATQTETPRSDRYVPPVVAPLEEQSIEDVPDEATAAYQRAETVIGAARPKCHLEWTVLAAVGRVESDHGRVDGGTLGTGGKVNPARFGAVLNGKHGRQKVRDTDAGTMDGQRRWDRAMGPLNFLPSTWNVVGVDSDGDGRRDPQDIDDASLAAAVVLCGRSLDLATTDGLAEALKHFNRARGYARAVAGIADGYTTELQEIAETEPVVVELPAPEVDPTEQPAVRNARRNRDRDTTRDRDRNRNRGRDRDRAGNRGPGPVDVSLAPAPAGSPQE